MIPQIPLGVKQGRTRYRRQVSAAWASLVPRCAIPRHKEQPSWPPHAAPGTPSGEGSSHTNVQSGPTGQATGMQRVSFSRPSPGMGFIQPPEPLRSRDERVQVTSEAHAPARRNGAELWQQGWAQVRISGGATQARSFAGQTCAPLPRAPGLAARRCRTAVPDYGGGAVCHVATKGTNALGLHAVQVNMKLATTFLSASTTR